MNARIISGRIYGVVLALAAIAFAAVGAVLIHWSSAGFPPEVLSAMNVKVLDAETLLGFKIIGWTCLVLAVVNVVFSVFAFLDHLWPLIANTVGWTLLLAPTLAHPEIATVALLTTFIGLTAVAVTSRYMNPAPTPALA